MKKEEVNKVVEISVEELAKVTGGTGDTNCHSFKTKEECQSNGCGWSDNGKGCLKIAGPSSPSFLPKGLRK